MVRAINGKIYKEKTMKPLLKKTISPFIVYVLVVFALSIPVYYFVVDAIWRAELDEHNEIVIDEVSYRLNNLKLSDDQLQKTLDVWNSIQPETHIKPAAANDLLKDSLYTITKNAPYLEEAEDRFRGLSTIIYVNQKPYRIHAETNIEESQSTISSIAATTLFLFVILILGLLWLNKRLSQTIWKAFKKNLEKLKDFDINKQTPIAFDPTDIVEFHELNQSLSKLINHNIAAFKTQKEFTENAAHELQTPLAILKNKIDLLLQSDDLTEKQYHLAEEMNRALLRSARINKNLLLLAKIENKQFNPSENIALDKLLQQTISTLQDYFNNKEIMLHTDIQPNIALKGNQSLVESLLSNLLINAIRHTSPQKNINISLSKSALQIANSGEKPLHPDGLFKRFSRSSTDNNGSGLGLAIVYEICKMHQWNVSYRFENQMHLFLVTF